MLVALSHLVVWVAPSFVCGACQTSHDLALPVAADGEHLAGTSVTQPEASVALSCRERILAFRSSSPG